MRIIIFNCVRQEIWEALLQLLPKLDLKRTAHFTLLGVLSHKAFRKLCGYQYQ